MRKDTIETRLEAAKTRDEEIMVLVSLDWKYAAVVQALDLTSTGVVSGVVKRQAKKQQGKVA